MTLKILIVDDETQAMGLYKEVLVPKGYKIQVIQSSNIVNVTLEKARSEGVPFQLMIVRDSQSLQGNSMIENLREKFPALPVLWFTDVSESKVLLKMVEEHVAVVLEPLAKEILQQRLEQLDAQIEAEEDARELALSQEKVSPFLTQTHLHLELGNGTDMIPLVIRYLLGILEYYGITEDDRFRVKLGLSETLINAIAHGNLDMSSSELKGELKNFKNWNEELIIRAKQPKYRDRKVQVDMRYTYNEEVVVIIQNEGDGFDHKAVLGGNSNEEESFKLFGRGLAMVQATSDSLEFTDKGRCVTMRYYINPAED